MQLKTPNKHLRPFGSKTDADTRLAYITFIKGHQEQCKFHPKPQKLEYKKVAKPSFQRERKLRKHLYHSLKQLATLSVFKQQLKRLVYRVETAGPVVTATVVTTMCVKAPDYRKDMLVRAKLQFKALIMRRNHNITALGVRVGLSLLFLL